MFFPVWVLLGPHTTPTDEDTAGYWLKLGSALANSGRYEEAAKALDRTIELDSNNTEAWNNQGNRSFHPEEEQRSHPVF